MGYASTLQYLEVRQLLPPSVSVDTGAVADTIALQAAAGGAVMAETGLLPHINAGVMGLQDIQRLRKVCTSRCMQEVLVLTICRLQVSGGQGLMLESAADRLLGLGGPHFECPDKVCSAGVSLCVGWCRARELRPVEPASAPQQCLCASGLQAVQEPAARLATIAAAGQAQVPFTSGLLVGIGETRAERIEALLALQALHHQYGHIQVCSGLQPQFMRMDAHSGFGSRLVIHVHHAQAQADSRSCMQCRS